MLVQVTPELSLDPADVLLVKMDRKKKHLEVWFRDPEIPAHTIELNEQGNTKEGMDAAFAYITNLLSRPRHDPMTAVVVVAPIVMEGAA